jgi:hypothetical protein
MKTVIAKVELANKKDLDVLVATAELLAAELKLVELRIKQFEPDFKTTVIEKEEGKDDSFATVCIRRARCQDS